MTSPTSADPRPVVDGGGLDPEGGARGRPRSKERESEILAAALRALVAEGYDAMTIEGVAAAAGAGKATVYRRWRSKADLVIDALSRQVTLRAEIVDTGHLVDDIRAYLVALQADLLGPNGALLATFMAERLRHPALAEAFEAQYMSNKRAQLRKLLRRAVARGELAADADIDLLAGVGPALMVYEFVQRGGRLPRDLPDRIVAQFFT
jgi:AcrR family transcriptional regulator